KQLHFKNGTGGVDSEGITLMNNDTASGIFIGAERDNENKKVPRPSILKYDANSTTTDTNGDGAQDLTATQEWNLTEALSGAGLHFADGDDANLGVEGVAYIPDTYLTAHGFTTIDGQTYRPADYKNSYAGLFLAAIEKNGHIYAFALSDDDTVSLVQDIDLPQTATNAGYSGPRDLIWDAEHQQLLAQGDNRAGSR
ncbi:MAG: nuclease, partial [Bifidobacterium crudilactis]|nr:nuclease [Bifidobacterium crudilactis]